MSFWRRRKATFRSLFCVPGPVKYGRARPTNLNWGVDAADIEKAFSIRR